MKERLFRGKRVRDGEWVVGYYFCKANLHRILLPESSEESCYQPYLGYVVDPATIGQNTGMYDDDCKQIFDGDIVRFMRRPALGGTVSGIGHVIYSELFGKFRIISPHGTCYNFSEVKELEVIGNIHDNLDLLVPKKEG